MNYLAHLFLAKPSPMGQVGALMGDFLKGIEREKLPFELEESIKHHLAVDSFTDSHPQIRELRMKFSKKRRRFAGIIIDVTFDNILLNHWNEYSLINSREFIHTSYRILEEGMFMMPPQMKHVVQLVVKHDVLYSYRVLSGIDTALNRIADRMSRPTALYDSIGEVELLYEEIEECFQHFFPELVSTYGGGNM